MVTALMVQKQKIPTHTKGYYVEVTGPAGAGKSTLLRALAKGDHRMEILSLPPVWEIQYFQFFIKNILEIMPLLVKMWGNGDRNITRRELAWMAMLNGWPELIQKESNLLHKVILFDQGPIFLMAILRGFGPTALHSDWMEDWWEKVYARWAQTLDLLIWLDAKDEVLIGRIRNRAEDHLIKTGDEQEIVKFLATYRSVYDDIHQEVLSKQPDLHVLRVDTSVSSVEEIVSVVNGVIDKSRFRSSKYL